MKDLSGLLCLTLLVCALVPSGAHAQPESRGRVCVYEHADFGGWEQCYGVGDSIADLGNLRNGISSIRVEGRARITIFEHPNFGGREADFTGDVARLKGFWNDEVDSLRVSGPGFGGRPAPRPERTDSVCVYQHTGYQGHSQCWDAGEEIGDLRSVGWNDGISSVRVFGRVRVAFFEHSGYQGYRLIVDRDLPDLTRLRLDDGATWNDRISSVRVGGGRRGRDWRD